MTVYPALIAYYSAALADARIATDTTIDDATLNRSGDDVRRAIDAVAGSVPADPGEADALVGLLLELARTETWPDQAAKIRANVVRAIPVQP